MALRGLIAQCHLRLNYKRSCKKIIRPISLRTDIAGQKVIINNYGGRKGNEFIGVEGKDGALRLSWCCLFRKAFSARRRHNREQERVPCVAPGARRTVELE